MEFKHFASAQLFKLDPLNSNTIYIAAVKRDETGIVLLKSDNGGGNWNDITGNLNTPDRSENSSLAVLGNGKIFIAINDRELQTWHRGKVFYTDDDGENWSEINFGQTEDRFVWSVFANPFNLDKIWISDGPLYGEQRPQPFIYKSEDGGSNWFPIYINVSYDYSSVNIIEASPNNRVYVGAGCNLFYTDNGGKSFISLDPPNLFVSVNIFNLAVHPNNPNILFCPLRGTGVAYSENGGMEWSCRNNGIISTITNLLAPHPFDPAKIYASSCRGGGLHKTENYGENWVSLMDGLTYHPFGDELVIDPIEPNTVWYLSDVPYIRKSTDEGYTWENMNNELRKGSFNFNSVYALAQGEDNTTIYALNNGYGIFKGTRTGIDDFSWSFLNLSEIDYSYTLAVEPENSDVIYSGYSRKPFEMSAKICASYDGGDNWFTALEVDNAEAVTSVVIDPSSPSIIYAGATGPEGKIFRSTDRGQSWDRLNEHFIMCTVWGQPQLIIDPDDPSIAYVATWLAGTWKTADAGATWTLLDEVPASSTALGLNALNSDVIYLADRASPKLWKTVDAGVNWMEIADFSADGAFLVNRVFADGDTVYVSTFGPGLHGGRLYKSTDGGGTWNEITGNLPRSVLDVAVDPSNRDIIYVTTHIHGAYRSDDGGATWSELQAFPDIGAYDIEVVPDNPTVLYACGLGGSVPDWCMKPDGYTFTDEPGVYKSTDSGSTWNQILVTNNECRAIRLHSENHNVLFATAMDDGLQISTDGGESWTSHNAGLGTQVPHILCR